MNIDDLKSSLSGLLNDPGQISAVAFAVLKDGASLHKLDIEGDAQASLCDLFINSIKRKIIDKNDINLLQYSIADQRNNAIYEYDLPALPDDLLYLNKIAQTEDIPLLSLQNGAITNIKAFLIQIGNKDNNLILYCHLRPIQIFKRDRFLFVQDSNRLKRINSEILQICDNFQMIYLNNVLIIININFVESNFKLKSVIQNAAKRGIAQLASTNLLRDANSYFDLLTDNKIAKLLVNVTSSSPVISKNITVANILKFCQSHPILGKKFKVNLVDDKIELKTKQSKIIFLKLLTDDYLKSELTKLDYETLAKDQL
jgi:hypothetical protein